MSGIAGRIVLASLAVAATAIGVMAIGVLAYGGAVFEQLMVEHGETVAAARAMFDQTVSATFGLAGIVATAVSLALALLLARRIERPLGQVGRAARRVAEGDLSARVLRTGPVEIRSLADSFNQMAGRLEEQERFRREFIANAAHELRTPLTNLQGYLEALR
ncbi:MAG: HAMP domain-containing protein, partial [Chloroflexi bacterium]